MVDSEIYQQNIIEHYNNPQNYGSMNNAQIKVEGANLSCGDEITFYINKKGDTISDIKFTAKSCAICTASASMLSEKVKGKSTKTLAKLNAKDIQELIGIKLSPIRLKCALLPLQTLKDPKIVGERR